MPRHKHENAIIDISDGIIVETIKDVHVHCLGDFAMEEDPESGRDPSHDDAISCA